MTEAEKKYGWEEGGKIVRITREAYDSILAQAREDAPIESCGYVLGTIDEAENIQITHNYRLTNTDHSEEHFSLDPKEQFAAIKYARTNGLKVIRRRPAVRQRRTSVWLSTPISCTSFCRSRPTFRDSLMLPRASLF